MTSTPVNLDALLREEGEVLLNGERYAVRPLTGRAYQAIQAMQRTKTVDLDVFYRVIGECVPGLGDRVLDLTVHQANAILAIASAGIAVVEDAAPKSESPTTASASSD